MLLKTSGQDGEVAAGPSPGLGLVVSTCSPAPRARALGRQAEVWGSHPVWQESQSGVWAPTHAQLFVFSRLRALAFTTVTSTHFQVLNFIMAWKYSWAIFQSVE